MIVLGRALRRLGRIVPAISIASRDAPALKAPGAPQENEHVGDEMRHWIMEGRRWIRRTGSFAVRTVRRRTTCSPILARDQQPPQAPHLAGRRNSPPE